MRAVVQLVLLMLWSPAISAQTLEVQGGGSDFLGNGGGLVLYGPNSETRFSAGVLNGRFAYGASEEFEFNKWDVTVGDRQFNLTGGQMYLATPVRGVSATRIHPFGCKDIVKATGTLLGYLGQHCNGDQLSVFAGAVGDVYSSPFFFGIQRTHLGAGFSYKRQLTRAFTVGTIQAIAGPRRTSLEELNYRLKHFELQAQAGWLQNNLQFGGTVTASATHFGAMAGRNTYVFNQPGEVAISSRVTVNNFALYGGYGFVNGSANLFQSNINTGESFNLGAHFNWFQVQVGDFKSGKISSQLLTTTEHSLHWQLSQFVTRSNGTTNLNFGGGYASNRFSASIGYNVLYFPLLANPFQKVLSIQIGLRIRAASINTGNIILPNGKSQWSVGVDDYLQTRMRVPSIGTGDQNSGRMVAQFGHGGKFVIEGWVTDKTGTPIEGAAVLIGKDEVFTDSQGHFSIRQRRKQNPIHVDFDNFMLPGSFALVSVSDTSPIKIILERK